MECHIITMECHIITMECHIITMECHIITMEISSYADTHITQVNSTHLVLQFSPELGRIFREKKTRRVKLPPWYL